MKEYNDGWLLFSFFCYLLIYNFQLWSLKTGMILYYLPLPSLFFHNYQPKHLLSVKCDIRHVRKYIVQLNFSTIWCLIDNLTQFNHILLFTFWVFFWVVLKRAQTLEHHISPYIFVIFFHIISYVSDCRMHAKTLLNRAHIMKFWGLPWNEVNNKKIHNI